MAKKATTTTKKSTTKPTTIKKITTQRHGWNSEQPVCEFMGALISMTNAKCVLEIGVFEGETAKSMVQALPKGGMYVGIDIKDYVKDDVKKVFIEEGKKGKVIEYVLDTGVNHMRKLPKNHFDIVFLDGDHSFDNVLAEFKLAETLITRNGIIVFHDALHLEDVKRVVEYAKHYKYSVVYLDTPEGRGLALVTK